MTDHVKMPSIVGAIEGHQEKQIFAKPILLPAKKLGNEKPDYLAPVFPAIEKSFVNLANFVLWKAEQDQKTKKWTKVPKTPSGANASTTNVKNHSNLQVVKKAFLENKNAFDGIGLVFIDGGNICGIDLDKVISEDGEIEPWADTILKRFEGTYIEKSVSGTGYHIFCKGIARHCGKGGPENRLEMYDKGRYFTLTGELTGEIATITDQQAAIDWLYSTHFKDRHEQAAEVKIIDPVTANLSWGSDDEILQRCNAKADFVNLFTGKWEDGTYPSKSEADQALCNKLSYYTSDHGQLDRLFRASGLMCQKWDERRGKKTYGQITIDTALSSEAAQIGIKARTIHLPLSLDIPIDEPEKIFHPNQIKWKKDTQTGEFLFNGAHGTAANLKRLSNAYGLEVSYNEMSKCVEVTKQGAPITGDLAASKGLSILEDLATINGYPRQLVDSNIEAIAHDCAYHPAVDWVKSKPWDSIPRIDELFATITLADPTKEKTSRLLFRKWLIGSVSILTGKTNKFEHVLIFVDPTGGIGKTRWFDALCPHNFRAGGISLDVNNKDSVLTAVSKWLVELGEIGSTFRKSDMEALKAFLSKSEDEFRQAYARTRNKYQRRTAFFGTVNDIKFLIDSTNNRRFWPIEVSNVIYQHDIDMQQLWAECEYLAEHGEICYLTPAENNMIARHNETFKVTEPIEELIRSNYDFEYAECLRRMTATDIAIEMGYRAPPKKSEVSSVGRVLRDMKIKYTSSKGLSRYYMPPHKSSNYFPAYLYREDDYSDLV